MESNSDRPWIVIENDYPGFDPGMFTIPDIYKDCIESVLVPGGMVSDRLDKIALQVTFKKSIYLSDYKS